MSKRAEQATLNAYPEMDMFRAPNPYKTQLRKDRRKCFRQGYTQAEKDTIERMIDWLDKNWRNYIMGPDADGCIGFNHWKNDFRKAIMEEK